MFKLNATILYTWGLMCVLVIGSILVTRRLSMDLQRTRWQNLLEIIVSGIEKQIEEVGLREPRKYLGFLGTLFLFVGTASLFTVIPGYEPPTGSLSTTAALAFCVFVAVPFFGIEAGGLGEYLGGLSEADLHHVAVQYHQRILAHPGAGRAPVRQHDERNDDSRHPADYHALPVAHRHERARPADRHGAGLHLQHTGDGLYRGCHAYRQTQTRIGCSTCKMNAYNERKIHG